MKIKCAMLLMLILGILLLLNGGCSAFVPPTGVWVSEELGMTIDFDDRLHEHRHIFRGTIVINGEIREIACDTYLIHALFYFIEYFDEDTDSPWSNIGDYLYRGYLTNIKIDGRMNYRRITFRPRGSDETYTFVRQERYGIRRSEVGSILNIITPTLVTVATVFVYRRVMSDKNLRGWKKLSIAILIITIGLIIASSLFNLINSYLI